MLVSEGFETLLYIFEIYIYYIYFKESIGTFD